MGEVGADAHAGAVPPTTPLPPPPPVTPPSVPPVRRYPFRARTDGSSPGVAAGLARALGVDVKWVRIAFVVATFFGGLGIAIYLAAWLLLPIEGSPEAGRSLVRRDLGGARLVFTVVVIVALVIMVVDGPGGDGFALPLLLVLLGVGLYVWRTDELARTGTTLAPPPTSPFGPPAPSPWPDAPAAAADLQATNDPAPVPKPPTSPLVPVVIAISLLALAGAAVLDRLDWVDVPLVGALGLALAVTAVGLIVSAWRGRGRGLIGWGVALALVTGISGVADAADVPFGAGIGERRYEPATLAELDDRYELGFGELIVDLDGLDLAGERVQVEADLGFGALRVLVPEGVTVEARADAGAGQVDLFGTTQDGIDADAATTRPGSEGAGTLVLDLRVGMGEIIVQEVG